MMQNNSLYVYFTLVMTNLNMNLFKDNWKPNPSNRYEILLEVLKNKELQMKCVKKISEFRIY